MTRTVRILVRLLQGLGIALMLGGIAVLLYARLVQPVTEGRLTVQGLRAGVEIERDGQGIPTIRAASPEDAWFGLGFVHAQDRLWQLDTHRRIGAGRLAEAFGPSAVDSDRFLRTLGVRRRAEQQWEQASPAVRQMLSAYAAGINAHLQSHLRARPPEFVLLGLAPQAWSPVDSIAWSTMMAWDLGGNWQSELLRMRLALKMPVERIQQLLPPYPGEKPLATADYRALYRQLGIGAAAAPAGSPPPRAASVPGSVPRSTPGSAPALGSASALVPASAPTAQLGALGLPWAVETGGEGAGSNNWVVAGSRSVTGRPLLANDPHQKLSAPALWYLARIEAPGLRVAGATMPGLPLVVLGQNEHVAWGYTNTNPDVQDLYLERIDPGDPRRYETPSGWASFETFEETIHVKGGADVRLTARRTRHGPVISDAPGVAQGLVGQIVAAGQTGQGIPSDRTDPAQQLEQAQQAASPDPSTRAGHHGVKGPPVSPGPASRPAYAIALRWTALDADAAASIDAGLAINRARSVDEFITAAAETVAPMQNMVVADVNRIAMVTAGRVPLRKPENDLRGLVPAPGWDPRYDWVGRVPNSATPRERDPARGWIATANQRPHDTQYPYFIGSEWAAPYRQQRIERLLAARPLHSLDSLAAIQSDVLSGATQRLLPWLRMARSDHPLAAAARRELEGFEGTMSGERAAPLIFWAWVRQLTRGVFTDDMGAALFDRELSQRSFRPALEAVLERNDASWCDDRSTPALESCTDQSNAALGRALTELQGLQGKDVSQWRWGQAHVSRAEHRPFSKVAPLARWFELRTPMGGDTFTVNVSRVGLKPDAVTGELYLDEHGPSLRALYDLADRRRSRVMLSSGQSGLFFNANYRNFLGPWSRVEYLPLWGGAGPLQKLELLPP